MTSKQDRQFEVLTTIARNQRYSILAYYALSIGTLILIHLLIDNSNTIFSGYGVLVYILAIIQFAIGIYSSNNERRNLRKYILVLVDKGETIVNSNEYEIEDKLTIDTTITAFTNCVNKLRINPKKYKLGMLETKETAAYSTKDAVVVSKSLVESLSDKQLEAVLAHEFGHLINNDLNRLIIGNSLSKTLSLFSGFIAFVLIWINWGLLPAMIFTSMVSLMTSLALNFSSHRTEEFADCFAAINGYGIYLISALDIIIEKLILEQSKGKYVDILRKMDQSKLLRMFSPHETFKNRVHNITNVVTGFQGRVNDVLERRLILIAEIVILITGALYLYTFKEYTIQSLLPFLMTGGLFIVCDLLMTGNAGLAHFFSKFRVKQKQPVNLTGVLSLVVVTVLYISGVLASYHFANLSESRLLAVLGSATLWIWAFKPLVALLGQAFDFFATISDRITEMCMISSLLMLISFFIRLPF